MKLYMRLGAAVVAASMVTGCATVTRGTKQKFEITSQPPGAEVDLTTGDKCFTPCTLKLKRKNGFIATITKRGYKPAQVTVDSSVHTGGAAGAAGNVLIGGIIGIVVDGTNGSMNDLRPNPLNVTLIPESEPGPIVAPAATSPSVPVIAPKQ